MEDKAFADLHPVAGVHGVLIASQVSLNYTRRPHLSTVSPDYLTTLITFDFGREWQTIQPPRTDAQGQPITCKKVHAHLRIHKNAARYAHLAASHLLGLYNLISLNMKVTIT